MAAGILALIAFSIYGSMTISTVLTERKQSELKNLTDTAISIVADYHARAGRGEMTEEEAQKRASEALRVMRYSGSEYFFIFNYSNVNLMHPVNKQLEGKDQSGLRDSTGKFFTKDMVDAAKQGGGFVSYLWPRPNQTEPSPKTTYAAAFPKWEWVIGTGVYVDDLAVASAGYRNVFLAFVGVSALVLIGLAFALGRSISRPINRLTSNMRSLANGDLAVTIDGTKRKDE
ncbi:cache domain-containing protein, partial [Microvirga sp. GCM10011540]|uniref:cache domain-containing protein n=1 Tax=Microvirga sp. GCM10011540 TaxID=3317338 RepID=UPI003623EB46